jgi:hypothetical protein
MLDKINLNDPVVCAVIGFLIIFSYQYYNKRIKNKKDDDDYTNNTDMLTLIKTPLLASLLIWLISNYLIESNNNNIDSNNIIESNNIKLNNNKTNNNAFVNPKSIEIAKDIALRDIFTDQPNF